MDLTRQRFLVLGISKSGFSAANYILDKGGSCKIFEESKSDKVKEKVSSLVNRGAIDVTEYDLKVALSDVDILVLSPGVPINHMACVEAKRLGIRILSEFEFGFESLNPLTVAVTGTNGKTTTVSLIEHIIKCAKKNVVCVGNVGYPVTSRTEEIMSSEVCVAEVSSFQLESIHRFCPHIACVLNISPDHLERHYNMDNYVFLKKRLVSNLTPSEYAVLNFDDQIVREFAKETRAKVIPVSLTGEINGAVLKNDELFFMSKEIMSKDDLPLVGEHNVYNALFAIAVCSVIGIDADKIKQAIISFKGVKHRIEVVLEEDGIKYINDSKSTNTASTITAIKSMDRPTVLIIGGSEKGEEYTKLFSAIKSSVIKHVVITGASRINMLSDAGKIGFGDITVVKNFDDAVLIAKKIAKEGETVLLSPACASFDSFNNYEERGERFIRLVGGNS